MSIAIKAEHVSKEYRLGIINHGMLFKDLKSWWAKRRGKEDPYSKIGTHHFDDQPDRFWALKDVSFEIEQGDRVGIVGRNGAGKSTLLKILSRVTEPTEGRVAIKGRVASLLEVGTGFHPELTGRDNIYLSGAIQGMKRREIDRRMDEIIAFSELEKFIDTPVKRYSSGMYVRLGFAVAAHLENEILLADEVLAVGDQEFQKKSLGKMEDVSKNEGRTVLFVSHNIAAVRSLCRKGILLDQGRKAFESDSIESLINTYYSEYADKRTKKTWELNNAPGSSSTKILGISVETENGKPLSIGMCPIIHLKLFNYLEGVNLDCTFELKSSEGVLLFHRGCIINHNHDSKIGTYNVRLVFEGLFLNAGFYTLRIIIGANQSDVLYKMDDILSFEILDSDYDKGRNVRKFPGVLFPKIASLTEYTGQETEGQ